MEWIEYQVCARLGKFPGELRRQPWEDILNIYICMGLEADYQAEKAKG